MDTQFKKGILDLCILSVISQKTVYGYGLKQEITKIMEINENTLYPLLRRLEKDGLLTTYTQLTSENRARKYYSITEEGKQYLKAKKKDWYQFIDIVDTFLGGKDHD